MPSSSKLPASKQSSSTKYVCPICEDVIEDSSPKVKGQESIFCEGVCNMWLQRGCIGLSKSGFQLVSTTREPFHCPHCALSSQRKEIVALKASVDQLFSREIVFLKSTISQFTSEISSLNAKLGTVTPSNSNNSHPLQNWSEDPANPSVVTPQQNTLHIK